MELIEVPLHAVAHSRAGDKGNRGNLSLMPYDPALYPLLAEQVTEARVLELAQAQHPFVTVPRPQPGIGCSRSKGPRAWAISASPTSPSTWSPGRCA